MLNLPLPQVIPPIDTALVLTPGTYSQLVIDTLGDTAPENDSALAAADDAQILLDQTDVPLADMDSDIASIAASGIGVDPTLPAQLSADVNAAGAQYNQDFGYFSSATIVLAVPDIPTIPPVDPVPIAGLTFQAGQVVQQGQITVAAAGGSIGGVPSSGDDLTWFLEGVPVGVTSVIPFLANVADPNIGGGRLVMTLDPSSDPSITVSQQGSNPQITLEAFFNITPTDAGHHSARIYIDGPHFAKPKVLTLTYQAA